MLQMKYVETGLPRGTSGFHGVEVDFERRLSHREKLQLPRAIDAELKTFFKHGTQTTSPSQRPAVHHCKATNNQSSPKLRALTHRADSVHPGYNITTCRSKSKLFPNPALTITEWSQVTINGQRLRPNSPSTTHPRNAARTIARKQTERNFPPRNSGPSYQCDNPNQQSDTKIDQTLQNLFNRRPAWPECDQRKAISRRSLWQPIR